MTTRPPDIARLMTALEATWPPAQTGQAGGFRLRRGAGGGKRVSAASPTAQESGGTQSIEQRIAEASAAMAAWGQGPLFQVTPDQAALDAELAGQGFAKIDPTVLYVATVAQMTGADQIPAAHSNGIVPALMAEIWAEGGIGPDRLAVMDRAAGPSVRLLGRSGDRPAGAAFVALDGDIAMIHAIEVRPAQRRKGVARQLIDAGARFARSRGAAWYTLAVTEANAPARALYEGLGMSEAGRYHYRQRKEG